MTVRAGVLTPGFAPNLHAFPSRWDSGLAPADVTEPADFVAGYSGGTVTAFHRLPFTPTVQRSV